MAKKHRHKGKGRTAGGRIRKGYKLTRGGRLVRC